MYQVFAYVADLMDGSTGIYWFDKMLTEEELETYNWAYDMFCDGDGLHPKAVLTFRSYEDAERCGINVITLEDFFA